MASEKQININRRYRFTGREGIQRFVEMARQAFPDIKFVLQHRLTSEGDNPVYVWSAKGTHTSTVENIAPTGETATLIGVTRISKGASSGQESK